MNSNCHYWQIKHFWDQLAWPDAEVALTFIVKIIDVSLEHRSVFIID